MKSRLASFVIALSVASSVGAYMLAPLDMACSKSALVVVVRTVSIADAGPREIKFPGRDSEHWFFAHSVARAVVRELVHCPEGLAVSAGDTIDIHFATSESGFFPGESRPRAEVSDVVMRGLPVAGEIGTYCALAEIGELRFGCRLSDSELAQYRGMLENSSEGSARK